MEPEITLKPMTAQMYHAFFRDYQNDAVLTNTRSQHVLEKVGFQLISQDAQRKYYRISREG